MCRPFAGGVEFLKKLYRAAGAESDRQTVAVEQAIAGQRRELRPGRQDAGEVERVGAGQRDELAGFRLAALTGNRLLYRDGIPIALSAGGTVDFIEKLDAASEWAAHKALLRGPTPAPRAALPSPAVPSPPGRGLG